jgi:hypothetical protein
MRSVGAEDGKRTGIAAVREGKRGSSPRKAGRPMPPRLAAAAARLEFNAESGLLNPTNAKRGCQSQARLAIQAPTKQTISMTLSGKIMVDNSRRQVR